jgi:hypothetical protein
MSEEMRKTENRISMEERDMLLYPIYFDAVQSSPFLTSDQRASIINKWKELKPEVNTNALRVQLQRMEKAHWENLELVNREGLRSKILSENEALKEMVIKSPVPADRKANSIVLINKLSANVGQLESLAPTVEIKINTNVNEDDLSIKMNQRFEKQGDFNGEE